VMREDDTVLLLQRTWFPPPFSKTLFWLPLFKEVPFPFTGDIFLLLSSRYQDNASFPFRRTFRNPRSFFVQGRSPSSLLRPKPQPPLFPPRPPPPLTPSPSPFPSFDEAIRWQVASPSLILNKYRFPSIHKIIRGKSTFWKMTPPSFSLPGILSPKGQILHNPVLASACASSCCPPPLARPPPPPPPFSPSARLGSSGSYYSRIPVRKKSPPPPDEIFQRLGLPRRKGRSESPGRQDYLLSKET